MLRMESPSALAEVTPFTHIVVGGGIAGVTCAETLSLLDPDCTILLLSASPLIKAVTNFQQISKALESFDVEEKPLCDLAKACHNVHVRQAVVDSFSPTEKTVKTRLGECFSYNKLSICTGGRPNTICKDNPYVMGIRDTETVQTFQARLKDTRRIVIVGNGGIATEMVYEIEGCEIVWAIKDDSITHTFVDPGASTFFLPELSKEKEHHEGPLKRRKYTHNHTSSPAQESETGPHGGALGPDWSTHLPMRGSVQRKRAIHVEYKVEVGRILTPEEVQTAKLPVTQPPKSICENIGEWPVYIELTNGKIYGCDLIISATGVTPNTSPFTEFAKFDIADDGGICVNDRMQTTIDDVYAAGDVCSATWQPAPHWMQMRLWTQARQMGAYAAKCMCAATRGQLDDLMMDFCFELFAHVTRFFNYKVVLLGKFNAQDLGTDHELLLRVTKGVEYVKTVMQAGRMQGALLIGDTDLEETFENLILNQLDLSVHGEHLLDPNIDIEDYFD